MEAERTIAGERLPVAVGALALVWIAVYWLTPAPAVLDRASVSPVIAGEPSAGGEGVGSTVIDPLMIAPTEAGSDEVAGGEAPVERSADEPVEPPRFRTYVVRRDETMQTIAQRELGSVAMWRAVARSNPSIDPNRLRVGAELRIPLDPQNIQGIDGAEEAIEGDIGETRYVVKRGDTLSEIASTIYGRSRLWTLIRDANRDLVGRDGTRLRPGMELVIPPAPAE